MPTRHEQKMGTVRSWVVDKLDAALADVPHLDERVIGAVADAVEDSPGTARRFTRLHAALDAYAATGDYSEIVDWVDDAGGRLRSTILELTDADPAFAVAFLESVICADWVHTEFALHLLKTRSTFTAGRDRDEDD